MCPSALPSDALVSAFGLERHRYVYIIGSGGKTTLMYALAEALARTGRRVVATTSTKIACPVACASRDVMIESYPAKLTSLLSRRSAKIGYVIAGKTVLEGGAKIGGYSLYELDALSASGAADCWLVEGDGAAGRSLKAHQDHEPVVSTQADLVIAVVGIDCVGKPLTDEHVHRAGRFRDLLGRQCDSPITVDDVASIILHPRGYFANVGQGIDRVLYISKASDPSARVTAEQLARLVKKAEAERWMLQVVVGDLLRPESAVEIID